MRQASVAFRDGLNVLCDIVTQGACRKGKRSAQAADQSFARHVRSDEAAYPAGFSVDPTRISRKTFLLSRLRRWTADTSSAVAMAERQRLVIPVTGAGVKQEIRVQ